MRNANWLCQTFIVLLAGALAALTSTPIRAAAETVAFETDARVGTIVIDTGSRRLYFVLARGLALRYVVGVGRAGRQWSGTSSIKAKFLKPDWIPPDAIRLDHPGLPAVIVGGSTANPMGAAAMTIAGGPYAIHGTNTPGSIGGFVSYGCIRMYDVDITDLYGRVHVGTRVVVMP